MKLTMTLGNQFRMLKIFFTNVIFAYAIIFALMFTLLKYNEYVFYILAIGYLIDFSLSLFLHYNYYKANIGAIVDIEEDKIFFSQNSKTVQFDITEIEVLEKNISARFERNNYCFAFEAYNFLRIKLKNKKELLVTCLMYSDINEVLKCIALPTKTIYHPYNTI